MITLKIALRTNAASCLFFGILFLAIPSSTASFLSIGAVAPTSLIMGLGAVLSINGAHLIWASRQASISKLLVYYFSAGDFAWVAGSLGLIASELWISGDRGITTTLWISAMVGLFGSLQLWKSKEAVAL
ncbi:MAG: hypothetical protein ACSHWQ_02645 [Spongiibacteraceae bacterium]